MKRSILLFWPLLFLISCGKSNEEKAQLLVSEQIKENLYHPDSYKPLNTKVDSAFVELATDRESINLLMEFLQTAQQAQEYVSKIESAERSMDIWKPDGYSISFGRGEYNRAKKERDDNQRLLDRLRDKALSKYTAIKERQKVLNIGDFNGWKVTQKYQSLNGTGSLTLSGESVYWCDYEFTECWGGISPEEYRQLQIIMKAIEQSDSIQDFQDAMIDVM